MGHREHAEAKLVAKMGGEMATYIIGFSRVNRHLRVAEFEWQLSYMFSHFQIGRHLVQTGNSGTFFNA